MNKKFELLVLMMLFFAAVTKAQQPAIIISDKTGWYKIGETTVDFSRERDEVTIIGADKFTSLKFKITEAPVDITSLEVIFEDGGKQVITVASNLDSPGESKIFDLDKGERSLKKIVFIYKTEPNNRDKKGHVEIWGLKINPDK